MIYLTLNDHHVLNDDIMLYRRRLRHTLMFTMFTEGIHQERSRGIFSKSVAVDAKSTRKDANDAKCLQAA